MKTAEELNTLKEEVEILNKKLAELTEEELSQVSGDAAPGFLEPVFKPSDPRKKLENDIEPPANS